MPKRYLRRPDGTLVEYSGGSGGDISREEFDQLSEAIVDKQPKTLIVNVTENENGDLIADKTVSEIVQHTMNGGAVQAMYDGDLYTDKGYDGLFYNFEWNNITPYGVFMMCLAIDEYNKVYWNSLEYDPAQSGFVKSEDINAVPLPETASVGQILKVTSVDDNGKITGVEAVDMPSGGDDVVARALFCGDVNAINLVSGDYESVKQAITNRAPVDITLYSYDDAGQLHLHHFDVLWVADNEDAIYVGEEFYWGASNPTELVSFG